MTRLELQTRALRALNDSPTSPRYWDKAEIQGYLDEGQEALAEDAPAFRRTFTVPRRAGSHVYQLPGVGTDIMAPYRVWLPDQKRRLEAKTLADLDSRHERWMEVTGEPYWWVPVSWDAWIIWPFPATGEGWLEVNAYVWPDTLLDDGAEPEFHPSQHQTLCTYAEFLGRLKQWDAREAAARLVAFFGGSTAVRSQVGVRQVQERFFQRERARYDRGDYRD